MKSFFLENITLPGFLSALEAKESERIRSQLKEWKLSNFAGYSRILDSGSDCAPDLKGIQNLASDLRGKFKNMVILGTGGSSLGSEALIRALLPPSKSPHFVFADNNDPHWYQWQLDSLKPDETVFYVVSKSGKTPETLSQFMVAREWIEKKDPHWKSHFVFCTDPQSGDLRVLAQKENIQCLEVPSAVGGRFSVLTPVGLLPAAFAGISPEDLLKGASEVREWLETKEGENSLFALSKALWEGLLSRSITVMMPYSSQLNIFSKWFCQLWAESLGKEGKGFTPYPALGTTDQHSQMQLYMEGPKDKVVIFLHTTGEGTKLPLPLAPEMEGLASFEELRNRSMRDLFNAEFKATRDAFTQAGVANFSLSLEEVDAKAMGALFFFFEHLTATTGAFMKVNPFNQPGVEQAKILTKKYLKESK